MVTPIDPDFMKHRTVVGKGEGGAYDIWGPVEPPTKLGIHGTAVAVDYDLCIADGACIDACPVNVFDWQESPCNPDSTKKARPIRENVCIFFSSCEIVCPVLSIKITISSNIPYHNHITRN